ncbi:MAG: DNA-binding protein [Clostridiales bacterium 43-6]|nr:MAG: DNA-binding protein [Clostridiales bacterium 43-6]
MSVKKVIKDNTEIVPMFKTVEQMSKLSGIGANKLRELVDNGEIEYIQNGNRRLLTERAIWDWYTRNCVQPVSKI